MKKFAAVAMVPFFAGFLFAQADQTRTDSSSTTWNGTLVDEGCRTTHSKETTSNADKTETKTTTTVTTECPVTTTTTNFGLMTPEGKYVHFDQAGNTRIAEMMKNNKEWGSSVTDRKPITVRVIGTANGDIVVIKEIQ